MTRELMLALVAVGAVLGAGCAASGSARPGETPGSARFSEDVTAALNLFKTRDASLKRFFDESAGYVVYPNVGKGGLIVGAAHGNGQVFDKAGRIVGVSALSQGTIGLQAGGQEFSELVFFKDDLAFDTFKTGRFEVAAQASAVAVNAGAATNADYTGGVAVFTMTKGGLMLEASVGGQKLSYETVK